MTNDQGEVIERSHSRPFGDSIEGVKQDIGYTGHHYDGDINLVYAQARYYGPVVGRFYSNDPVGFVGHAQRGNSPVHGFNLYAYANNNPYKYTDPDGEFAVLAILAVELAGYVGTAIVGEIAGVYLTEEVVQPAINQLNEASDSGETTSNSSGSEKKESKKERRRRHKQER